MDMATATKHWTAADLATLPDDGNRYEIVDGVLYVTPGPEWNHQWISSEIYGRLWEYLASTRAGVVLYAPADVELSDDTVVEPDVFVVPLVDGRRPERWAEVRQLLLVIEILSPGTARRDRTVKRRLYQRVGAGEYWIVDGVARAVERWRPGDEQPEVVTGRLEWHPAGAGAPLVLDLPAIFTTALGG